MYARDKVACVLTVPRRASQAQMAFPPLWFRFLKWMLAAGLLTLLVLMAAGNGLLIVTDPLPRHVDAVVVLQGSVVAEKTRIAAAMAYLQGGFASRVLLSVPKESYWPSRLRRWRALI